MLGFETFRCARIETMHLIRKGRLCDIKDQKLVAGQSVLPTGLFERVRLCAFVRAHQPIATEPTCDRGLLRGHTDDRSRRSTAMASDVCDAGSIMACRLHSSATAPDRILAFSGQQRAVGGMGLARRGAGARGVANMPRRYEHTRLVEGGNALAGGPPSASQIVSMRITCRPRAARRPAHARSPPASAVRLDTHRGGGRRRYTRSDEAADVGRRHRHAVQPRRPPLRMRAPVR
jgi:hypothetical protein